MDLPRLLWPYWHVGYWTDLSYEQVACCLEANVLAGFALYSPKPYYGQFMPQGFQARRVWSKFKRASLSPTVTGTYGMREGQMIFNLRVLPHPIFLGLGALVLFVEGTVGLDLLTGFLRTWDIVGLVRGMMPPVVPLAIFWGICRLFCGRDVRFWENTLRLRRFSS